MKFITKKKLKEEVKKIQDELSTLKTQYVFKIAESNLFKEDCRDKDCIIKDLKTKLKRTTTYKEKYANEVKEKEKLFNKLDKTCQAFVKENEELKKELLEVNNDLFEARKIIETLNKQLVKFRKDVKEYEKNKSERN